MFVLAVDLIVMREANNLLAAVVIFSPPRRQRRRCRAATIMRSLGPTHLSVPAASDDSGGVGDELASGAAVGLARASGAEPGPEPSALEFAKTAVERLTLASDM